MTRRVLTLCAWSGPATVVIAGLVISALGVCLVVPLTAVIGVHMVLMEGRTSSTAAEAAGRC